MSYDEGWPIRDDRVDEIGGANWTLLRECLKFGPPKLAHRHHAGASTQFWEGVVRKTLIVATALIGVTLLSFSAEAAEKYNLRALGTFQGQIQSSEVERPFFEGLAAASGGMFEVQFRPMDEVGLKGFDAMRMLKLGIFDVMAIQLGYVSGDEPFVLGLDLPGVAPDLATSRKVMDAYRDVFNQRLEKQYNAVALALWPFPGQVFFCKTPISGLADLKGKKVRSFTPAMAKLIEYFGGIPVTLAFSEVYPSLQRGVADCGITATLSGNTSKWFEVTEYLYPLSIGWGIQAHVVNKDFLKKLSPEARQKLTDGLKKMENDMWQLAIDTFQEGINCNIGQGECKRGVPGKMKLSKIVETDLAKLRKATEAVVLPGWGADCNKVWPECTKAWNDTVGKTVSMTIR